MSEVSEWDLRLAQPSDSAVFADWIVNNPFIDPKDVQDGLKANNPTSITFVMCHNGLPVWFAPCYCTMHVAHMGVNPAASVRERKEGLSRILAGVGAFAIQFGIRAITTLTKSHYPVARWAKANGFEADSRELYKCDLNKWLPPKVDENGFDLSTHE